ncbi:glycogen debranching enzyme, partial [Actinomadura rugatobispora]
VKLIAEPWDVGEGGYQVGNFPPLWTEWNGKYRDTVRDYWRGRPATLPEFASRLTGSSDLYADDGRRPSASINFVTCHDGFTMHDLVSYDTKHNEANGEGNRDGTDDNRSWNCGAEGPTDDLGILALRERQKRNFMATLFLTQGVPMLSHGDEIGRTQRGNNNAYCQDDELSWVDWDGLLQEHFPLLDFVQRLSRLRREHPVFRRRRFFQGRAGPGRTRRGPARAGRDDGPVDLPDLLWFSPDGREMAEADWSAGFNKSFSIFLNGDAISEPGRRGERIRDDSFLLLFNAHDGDLRFVPPPAVYGGLWSKVIDTADPLLAEAESPVVKAGESVLMEARSLQVLRRV